MPKLQQLLDEYKRFNDRFKNGNGGWTPSREDWLHQEEVGRKILLAAIQQYIPNVNIDWCNIYLDPHIWHADDFLERVIPTVAYALLRKEALAEITRLGEDQNGGYD